MRCGYPKDELRVLVLDLFKGQDVGFDLGKIDYSAVEDGWNSKVSRSSNDVQLVNLRTCRHLDRILGCGQVGS